MKHRYSWHLLACAALLAAAFLIFRRPGPAPGPAEAPAPTVKETGVTRTYDVVAAPVAWELRPGLVTDAYAYDGTVPGTEIRVTRGDRVKVTLTNKLDEPTTIHWHGVRVPAGMDGVPMVSQEPVPPGGTFTYEFVVPDAGTFFYHSHVHADEQVDRGLYGAFIVEPAEGAIPDAVIALDDWLLDPSGKRLDTVHTLAETEADNLLDSVSESVRPATAAGHMMPDGTMMGGMAHQGMMHHAYDPNMNGRYGGTLTANGKTGDAVAPIAVPPGGARLLRLINASNAMTHELKAEDGRLLEIVAVDGTALPKPIKTGALTLPPAKRFDVLLRDADGKPWALLEKRDAGSLRIPVAISGEAGPMPSFASDAPAPPDLRRRAPDAVVAVGTDRMMDPTTWTINGKPYDMEGENDPLATFAKGTWVKIRFMNGTPMAHPMHLHGQFMTVIARDGKAPSQSYRQDVVVVRPNETVDVAVLADNPGDWVLHCHNLEHEEHGLMAKIRVE